MSNHGDYVSTINRPTHNYDSQQFVVMDVVLTRHQAQMLHEELTEHLQITEGEQPMSIEKGVWINISQETYRDYCYADGRVIRIDNPARLMVSENDSHRVETKNDTCYYIKPNWDYIQFDGGFVA